MEDFTLKQAQEQIERIKENTRQADLGLNFCCDQWWNTLTESQKYWVHFFFYDIHLIENTKVVERLSDAVDMKFLHDSKLEELK